MLKKFGLLTLAAAAVLAVVQPATASAQEYYSNGYGAQVYQTVPYGYAPAPYGYGDGRYVDRDGWRRRDEAMERREWRERERHEYREREWRDGDRGRDRDYRHYEARPYGYR